MSKLKNTFSWSVSRDRLFNDCCRAYYYHYYAAWGGWEESAPELCRKAYLLKNIHSIDTWIGDAVHRTIKWILENKAGGKDIVLEQARKRIKEYLINTWEQSRQKQWQHGAKQHLNLFEHYYGREPGREVLAIKVKKTLDCIGSFYKLGIPEMLSGAGRGGFLAIDELDSFELDGVKVFAVPDFALKQERYTLFDWKTGKPSDKDVFQLSFYVLYAGYRWRAALEDVDVVPVYLADAGATLASVTVANLGEVKNYVAKSVAAMRAVLIDVALNEADIARCPKTPFTKKCAYCRFQEICK